MKTTRLLGYAALGIIIGLLSENAAIRLKQKAAGKKRALQDDAEHIVHKARKRLAKAMHHHN